MEGDSLPDAVLWVRSTLLGEVGTTIAVLAVAIAGFNMLRGHIQAREGVRILLGCFILFGAPVIAQGLIQSLPDSERSDVALPTRFLAAPEPTPAPALSAPSSVNPFDPYIGATRND